VRTVFLFILLISVNACGIYSFTGASIPEGAQTVKINLLENNARIVVADLAQTLTDDLQEKCGRETTLKLTNSNPDIEFFGQITQYDTRPAATAGSDQAALNELIITVEVDFKDYVNDKEWSKSFSQKATFEQSSNLTDVQDQLIDEIGELLINAIFNEAFVNW